MTQKPRIFVGSSTQALPVARAIQKNLKDDAYVQVWDEGVFSLSQQFMESLTQAAGKFDFAILVMAPDDDVTSGGLTWHATRDNVLIELGLFLGSLGRERTFLVVNQLPEMKIPADLQGLKFATYETPPSRDLLQTALQPACDDIRDTIAKRGRAAALRELEDTVQALVKYSMSASIFHHLCGIALLNRYEYRDDATNRREMYFLRDNNLIRPTRAPFIDFDAALDRRNLVDVTEPTPTGWMAVRLRRAEIPAEMRADRANLRVDPAQWD